MPIIKSKKSNQTYLIDDGSGNNRWGYICIRNKYDTDESYEKKLGESISTLDKIHDGIKDDIFRQMQKARIATQNCAD